AGFVRHEAVLKRSCILGNVHVLQPRSENCTNLEPNKVLICMCCESHWFTLANQITSVSETGPPVYRLSPAARSLNSNSVARTFILNNPHT
uniref:Ovule protein n=1 Tax=Mesocestoides corti TaxID=53468 RepID=A0A5K3F6X1_MESCO